MFEVSLQKLNKNIGLNSLANRLSPDKMNTFLSYNFRPLELLAWAFHCKMRALKFNVAMGNSFGRLFGQKVGK
jgi:hypothetical protein